MGVFAAFVFCVFGAGAGYASGATQSIYAGTLDGSAPDESDTAAYAAWQAQVADQAQLIGASVGYITSAGLASNVSNGGSIAQSGVVNNYLSHANLDDLARDLENCMGQESGCSADELFAIIEKYRAISHDNDLAYYSCYTEECRLQHQINMADADALRSVIDMGGVSKIAALELFRDGLLSDDWLHTAVSLNIQHREQSESACVPSDLSCVRDQINEIQGANAFEELMRTIPGPDMVMAAIDCQDGSTADCLMVMLEMRARATSGIKDDVVDALGGNSVRRGADEYLDEVFEGSNYSRDEYYAYAERKIAAGETPKSPEDYIATRQQFDRGSEAHRAAVDEELVDIRQEYPDARVVTDRSVNSSDGCTTCRPDIMAYDPDTGNLTVIEVKTGNADFTTNQTQVYADMADGSATMNAGQLDALGLDSSYAGRPISEIPEINGIEVIEARY